MMRCMRMQFPFQLFLLLSFLTTSIASNENNEVVSETCADENASDGESSVQSSSTPSSLLVPDACGIVLAHVSENDWRVYSLMDRKRSSPIVPYGDVVQQLADMDIDATSLSGRTWNGQETGGQYEGYDKVDSLVPGIAMMARNVNSKKPNLLPFVPRVDEAGLTRQQSPGAGSITHYHNYTLFFTRDIGAGEELIMPNRATGDKSVRDQEVTEEDADENPTLFDLIQTGYCLDNIKPKKSRIKDAGRGAFATRDFEEGTIVAPVPVLPISRAALEFEASDGSPTYQLLLNYCFGSKDDPSTLFYPFGPWINLINHYPKTNVKLQWRNQKVPSASKDSVDMMMMMTMELVATKDIKAGEELFLDYGSSWEEAWHQHRQNWEPVTDHYSPGYVVDDTIRLLRTESEQKDHPYPPNIDTSCFYRYSDRTGEEKASIKKDSSDKVQTFQWKATKGLYDPKFLRPCKVLQRKETAKGRSGYAVRMFNRPGLDEAERIPKGEMHLVTHIPRNAIRITDKPGTTDQHLPGAFRHEINLPDDVFTTEFMKEFHN
ncbi:unnamed protein product [Cylindrotheca closterium]|uniref:SET domain-containing protein n=1 Tax=Cylindrotheca closterium TaxID=2856 RepID=A0AAD2FZY4_9STRA|nr:unnamed protein product [Cylindrotheca closterium]